MKTPRLQLQVVEPSGESAVEWLTRLLEKLRRVKRERGEPARGEGRVH